MKVEGDSDGDGDLSGGDTERSGGSSRGPDRDSSAEEADEPDSDDSSEMDESECERRRNECLDNLGWYFEVMFTNRTTDYGGKQLCFGLGFCCLHDFSVLKGGTGC